MLHRQYKKRLKSASTNIIRNALGLYGWTLSYDDLHEISGRGTPEQMSNYFNSLAYYDLINNRIPYPIAERIDSKKLTNNRTNTLIIPQSNRIRVGINSFDNRLNYVSSKINSTWLALEKSAFKTLMKRLFI